MEIVHKLADTINKCHFYHQKNLGSFHQYDEVAEWLRRWTANPMGSARVGSNPILVGKFLNKFDKLFVGQFLIC